MQAGDGAVNRATAKEILQRIPYGIYVIGSVDGAVSRAMIADWVMQVSFTPLILAAAMETGSLMHQAVIRCGYFSVNLLPAGGKSIAKDFLKSPVARDGFLGGRGFGPSAHGMPVLKDAAAALECRVTNGTRQGDHEVVFGEITDAIVLVQGPGILTLQETGWKYSK
jgi:flavin reductase (DIM6/NTAB) family NADH-FMN oxidoreductase RutF